MTSLAHSANPSGQTHDLVDHLVAVAKLARVHGERFGAGELAYWAGLWHDVGKFHPDFQSYLDDPEKRRGPDHSSAGMVKARGLGLDLLAGPIGGHHGGLPDKPGLLGRFKEKKGSATVREALRRAGEALDERQIDEEPTGDLTELFPTHLRRAAPEKTLLRSSEVLGRFLLSALADADFLDTEAHFSPSLADWRGVDVDLPTLGERFDRDQAALTAGADDTPLNRLRREIFDHCVAAADEPPGLYRLTVPTGGGKTRSGMAFALAHAEKHGLDRVIVAIPYTSIIEQTADEYRKIFGDGVLEHHSAVERPDADDDSPVTYEAAWPRLASQNWDAPIVVTTTVQLFESLFARSPGRCRKLHRIAGSVVILDEVQTLPPGLLAPILDVLRELVDHYRVTVVLSTATQPAVSEEPYSAVFDRAREIVPEPGRYFAALRRVAYEVPSVPWSWDQVADEMMTSEQCLAIVNTKKDALALFEALRGASGAPVHLSTALCGAHRRAALAEIRQRLDRDEPCRLVSTQVVEAGVDLDFPLVLRALGPLDRIVQAAGRCNREGRLGTEGGRVVVFEPAESTGAPPGEYETGLAIASNLLKEPGLDLHDPKIFARYFRELSDKVEIDRCEIQPLRANLDYPQVAERFRLIPDDTVPVVVPYGPAESEIDDLLTPLRRQFRDMDAPPRKLFERLQPYVVNLYENQEVKLRGKGLVTELAPGLLEWHGHYDDILGLLAMEGLTASGLVV